MHHDGAFLREMIGLCERLVTEGLLRHDALDDPGAVPHGQEMDLSARTPVVEPTPQGDGLAFVSGDVFDVQGHESVSARSNRCRARLASSSTESGAPVLAS